MINENALSRNCNETHELIVTVFRRRQMDQFSCSRCGWKSKKSVGVCTVNICCAKKKDASSNQPKVG